MNARGIVQWMGRVAWYAVKLVWASLLLMTAILMFLMSVLVTLCVACGEN